MDKSTAAGLIQNRHRQREADKLVAAKRSDAEAAKPLTAEKSAARIQNLHRQRQAKAEAEQRRAAATKATQLSAEESAARIQNLQRQRKAMHDAEERRRSPPRAVVAGVPPAPPPDREMQPLAPPAKAKRRRHRDLPPALTPLQRKQLENRSFAAARREEVEIARSSIYAERASLVLSLRLADLASRQEAALRAHIRAEEQAEGNQLYRRFFEEKLVIATCEAAKSPGAARNTKAVNGGVAWALVGCKLCSAFQRLPGACGRPKCRTASSRTRAQPTSSDLPGRTTTTSPRPVRPSKPYRRCTRTRCGCSWCGRACSGATSRWRSMTRGDSSFPS